MQAEIEKIIRESLPEQVGQILRAELEDGQKAKERVLQLELVLKNSQEAEKSWKQSFQESTRRLSEQEELDKRKLEVRIAEDKLTTTICELKVKNAEESKKELFDLVRAVFRNPVLKESVSEVGNDMVPSGSGYLTSASKSLNRTIERTTE